MKIHVKFILLALALIIVINTSLMPLNNQVHISGKFYSDDKKVSDQFVGLQFFVRTDDKIIYQSFVLLDNTYEMTFNHESKKTYDFFVYGIGIDETYIKSFNSFKESEIKLDIKFPNTYKIKSGNIICPKCNKANKVYPIIYGTPKSLITITTKGDTIRSNIVDRKYYAGTCVSSLLSPNYYCDRDRIKF